MRFSILTLGCKVNQSESLAIERDLLERGHSLVELGSSPDICIVNTCTVTAKSDYQSRQLIRRALRANSAVYVTGCYSALQPLEIKGISDKIQIVPNERKDDFFLSRFGRAEGVVRQTAGRSRFFAKIQDGCDNSCTFCAVRLARGKSRSFDPGKIVASIQEAHRLGHSEVVLTGIHIGKYGHDLTPRTTLASLMREILTRTSIPRIRISSLEANEIGDDVVELLAEERICKHIHLPLQSGDNRILRRMGRRYTIQQFMNTLDRVLTLYQDISVGTDVIAGFPGEDYSAFEATMRLVSNAGFAYLHAFPFSRREDTPAAGFDGQIPATEIKSRVARLRAVSATLKRLYMGRFVGRYLDAIVEEVSPEGECILTTGNYLKMRMRSPGLREGSLVYCRVEGATDNILIGSVSASGDTPQGRMPAQRSEM